MPRAGSVEGLRRDGTYWNPSVPSSAWSFLLCSHEDWPSTCFSDPRVKSSVYEDWKAIINDPNIDAPFIFLIISTGVSSYL